MRKHRLAERLLAPRLRNRGYQTVVHLRAPGGGKLLCDLDDWIPWNVYLHGRYLVESRYEAYMLAQVHRGAVVFDIGANIGYYTVQFGRLAGAAGRVYAFEPLSYQYRLLLRNLSLNGLQHVVASKSIVSAAPGRGRIYAASRDNSGRSSLAIETADYEDVETITIDMYCAQHGIDRIDIVKIDVEGHELRVLEGMAGKLSARQVGQLFVEVNAATLAHGAATPAQLFELLDTFGYRPYSIATGSARPYEPGRDESLVLFRAQQ
jgi:FkbM family methyltransferase